MGAVFLIPKNIVRKGNFFRNKVYFCENIFFLHLIFFDNKISMNPKKIYINKYFWLLVFSFQFFINTSFQFAKNNWGWHAHELICEKAIFTLPESLLPLYKKNISFLLEHVNAPDRRRFTSEMEGFRHYIDLDSGVFFPQYLTEAAAFFVPITAVTEGGDSLLFSGQGTIAHRKKDYFFKSKGIKKIFGRDSIIIADSIFHSFLQNNILKNLENKEFYISVDSFWAMCEKEHFSRKQAKTPIKYLVAHDFLSKKRLVALSPCAVAAATN